jgi:hypothetical protein
VSRAEKYLGRGKILGWGWFQRNSARTFKTAFRLVPQCGMSLAKYNCKFSKISGKHL